MPRARPQSARKSSLVNSKKGSPGRRPATEDQIDNRIADERLRTGKLIPLEQVLRRYGYPVDR